MAMGPSGARSQEWPCWLVAGSKLLLLLLLAGDPCEGGVEYLHRDPANRRRWRKGKSHIWDSKIWSRVPRDSDPRKTALARSSSIYRRQTRPLVREGAPQKQDRNCQTVIYIYLGLDTKTYWLTDWTVSRNVTLTLTLTLKLAVVEVRNNDNWRSAKEYNGVSLRKEDFVYVVTGRLL
jgi:hypothetical protein